MASDPTDILERVGTPDCVLPTSGQTGGGPQCGLAVDPKEAGCRDPNFPFLLSVFGCGVVFWLVLLFYFLQVKQTSGTQIFIHFKCLRHLLWVL